MTSLIGLELANDHLNKLRREAASEKLGARSRRASAAAPRAAHSIVARLRGALVASPAQTA